VCSSSVPSEESSEENGSKWMADFGETGWSSSKLCMELLIPCGALGMITGTNEFLIGMASNGSTLPGAVVDLDIVG